MKYRYKSILFENFENRTLTDDFLNQLGRDGWELKEVIMLGYDGIGSIKGICVFMKEMKE